MSCAKSVEEKKKKKNPVGQVARKICPEKSGIVVSVDDADPVLEEGAEG